jgi:hypothetical protein
VRNIATRSVALPATVYFLRTPCLEGRQANGSQPHEKVLRRGKTVPPVDFDAFRRFTAKFCYDTKTEKLFM